MVHCINLIRLSKMTVVVHQKPKNRHYWSTNLDEKNTRQNQATDFKLKCLMTNSNQSSPTKTPTFQKNHIQIYELCLTSASQQGELSKKLHELKTNKSTGPNGVPA